MVHANFLEVRLSEPDDRRHRGQGVIQETRRRHSAGQEYAQALDLKFAFQRNGHGVIEHDFHSGRERELSVFPSPMSFGRGLNQHLNLDRMERETDS